MATAGLGLPQCKGFITSLQSSQNTKLHKAFYRAGYEGKAYWEWEQSFTYPSSGLYPSSHSIYTQIFICLLDVYTGKYHGDLKLHMLHLPFLHLLLSLKFTILIKGTTIFLASPEWNLKVTLIFYPFSFPKSIPQISSSLYHPHSQLLQFLVGDF